MSSLMECLTAIEKLMTYNFLQIDSDMNLWHNHLALKLWLFVSHLATNIKSTAKNLGITFDYQLNLKPHIDSL